MVSLRLDNSARDKKSEASQSLLAEIKAKIQDLEGPCESNTDIDTKILKT